MLKGLIVKTPFKQSIIWNAFGAFLTLVTFHDKEPHRCVEGKVNLWSAHVIYMPIVLHVLSLSKL